MDISKAFDTIQRSRVIEDIKTVLQEDELHLVNVLIEVVKLAVCTRSEKGKTFTTSIGTPQGDCPSLVTLYLAKVSGRNPETT